MMTVSRKSTGMTQALRRIVLMQKTSFLVSNYGSCVGRVIIRRTEDAIALFKKAGRDRLRPAGKQGGRS